MIEYSEGKWKDNKLFVRNKDTGISVKQDPTHSHMYRIEWTKPKFEVSEDLYNLTRAKDNALRGYVNSQDTSLDLQ